MPLFFLFRIYSISLLHVLLTFSISSPPRQISTCGSYSMWIVSTVNMIQLHYICTYHWPPPPVWRLITFTFFYCGQMCWGQPTVWRWFEREKYYDWWFGLFKLGLIYSTFSVITQNAFLCQVDKCLQLSSFWCVCVSLQYRQWFRRSFVCLPESTDCPVHPETEGHQQVPHEKVSLTSCGK